MQKDIIITTDSNSNEKIDYDDENITKGIRFRKKVKKTKSQNQMVGIRNVNKRKTIFNPAGKANSYLKGVPECL